MGSTYLKCPMGNTDGRVAHCQIVIPGTDWALIGRAGAEWEVRAKKNAGLQPGVSGGWICG